MGSKPKSVSMPPDPDPRPTATGDSSQEVKQAAREEQKRNLQTYGRQKTILAGASSQDNSNKKTILGG